MRNPGNIREWGVGSVVVGSALGAPQIFAPSRSETLQTKGFGASGLKIGVPQKRRFDDRGSKAPSLITVLGLVLPGCTCFATFWPRFAHCVFIGPRLAHCACFWAWFRAFCLFWILVLRAPLPLTAFKDAPNPKFVQNLSQRLFLRVPVRRTGICPKIVKICPKITVFQILTIWGSGRL